MFRGQFGSVSMRFSVTTQRFPLLTNNHVMCDVDVIPRLFYELKVVSFVTFVLNAVSPSA